MARRLPDPAWKSGPPDPPSWTVHEHEFYYSEADVEVMDGYVYVYQRCGVDDGHPHDAQRCEAKQTITYRATTVEQVKVDSLSGVPIGGEVDPRGPHRGLHSEAIRHADDIIRDDPFQYDVLEGDDFEVIVDLSVGRFAVLYEHDATEVHEW